MGVTDYWVPSVEAVQALEERLPALLDSTLAEIPGASVAERPRYYRQYVGIRIRSRDLVYVNGFDARMFALDGASHVVESWRAGPITVCDGAWTAFGVVFDPRTNQFGRLEFNAPLSGERLRRSGRLIVPPVT